MLAWIDDDPYGFCYRLEKDAAKVLDKAGLAALVKQVRARFDGAAKATPKADGTFEGRPERVRRRWGEALRALYLAQKNVDAYVTLADETGLTGQDCHAIATLLGSPDANQKRLSAGWNGDRSPQEGTASVDGRPRPG